MGSAVRKVAPIAAIALAPYTGGASMAMYAAYEGAMQVKDAKKAARQQADFLRGQTESLDKAKDVLMQESKSREEALKKSQEEAESKKQRVLSKMQNPTPFGGTRLTGGRGLAGVAAAIRKPTLGI